MYKTESSNEGGTLVQLRNLIDRRNVSKGKDVKNQVNEVEDFLEIVVECHLIAAAMHHFGMSCTSDRPSSNGFPSNIKEMPLRDRVTLFYKQMMKIIDDYVVPRKFALPQDKGEHIARSSNNADYPTQAEVNTNPHLKRISLEHHYSKTTDVLARPQRRLPPTVTDVLPRSHASQRVKTAAPDGVFDYATAVLNSGLLLLEFKDAIREGDGPRILRVWKVLMLYFTHAGHKNYRLEAFHLQSMVNATALPKIAAQLTWGRVLNVRGGSGHNIPLDLAMEHLNRTVKDYVAGLGANKSESTILQCGSSLGGIMAVCKSFDKYTDIAPESVQHTKRSTKKDRELILKQLVSTSRVFDYVPGRKHKSFAGVHANIASAIDKKKLFDWIQKQKVKLHKDNMMAKAFGHVL